MKENQMDNNNIIIRAMTHSDVEDVYRIEEDTFSDAWSLESFIYSVSAEYDYSVVAEYDGEILGYAIMMISFDTADIANIAVDIAHRRKGIAEKLMKRLLEHGNSTGVSQYMLEVRQNNTVAINLYEKFGFEIIGKRKNYYSNPVEDALVMCLSI